MSRKRYTQYMYSYPHKTAYRPLEGLGLSDFARCLAGPGHSLYLHVPFCETKCGYCNLFSVTGQNASQMDVYLDTVERQLSQYQEVLSPLGTEFADFTIGGGTPLLLTTSQLNRMFAMVRSHLSLADGAQIIIETAPNQTTKEKLGILKEEGVTRVSMGIQSFSDKELRTLRRSHSSQKARESLSLLKDFGFPCVNIDFIYGVPGQTVSSLMASLAEAMNSQPDELFLYPLYIKHGVLLEQDIRTGMVLDEKLAYEQYREACAFLKAQGYIQDSMRRFVRAKARRDVAGQDLTGQGLTGQDLTGQGLTGQDLRAFQDCGFGVSLALGCGGRSYLGALHTCSPYGVGQADCLARLREFENTEDFTAVRHGFLLSQDEIQRRYVIRHLLILPGLKKSEYCSHFHGEASEDFPILAEWVQKGYVRDKGGYLALTPEGMGLSDWLGPQLISPLVQARMDEWEEEYGKANAPLQRQS